MLNILYHACKKILNKTSFNLFCILYFSLNVDTFSIKYVTSDLFKLKTKKKVGLHNIIVPANLFHFYKNMHTFHPMKILSFYICQPKAFLLRKSSNILVTFAIQNRTQGSHFWRVIPHFKEKSKKKIWRSQLKEKSHP